MNRFRIHQFCDQVAIRLNDRKTEYISLETAEELAKKLDYFVDKILMTGDVKPIEWNQDDVGTDKS